MQAPPHGGCTLFNQLLPHKHIGYAAGGLKVSELPCQMALACARDSLAVPRRGKQPGSQIVASKLRRQASLLQQPAPIAGSYVATLPYQQMGWLPLAKAGSAGYHGDLGGSTS